MVLKDIMKKRVISDMLGAVNPKFPWKILIVDDLTLKILSSAIKMFQLADANVSVVEKISLKRKPLRDMEAVYFISPTMESVNSLILDFEPSKRLYAACHVFFSSPLNPDFLKKISEAPLVKYIKTMKEVNVDFFVVESQVFLTSLEGELVFSKIYSNDVREYRQVELEMIAHRIATACVTLSEYPIVRYGSSTLNGWDQPLPRKLASMVQDKIDELFRLDTEIDANDRPRSTLLILDRTFDLYAPLLHEYTYQAMIHDLVNIEGNKYEYETTNANSQTIKKSIILDEDDKAWSEMRHMHIADCLTKLTEDFNKFRSENQIAGKGTDGAKTAKDVAQLMKSAPQYFEQLSKFSVHMQLVDNVMGLFKTKKLEDVSGIEQNLATGENEEKEPVKNPIPEITALLKRSDISENDKVRSVLLYSLFKGGLSKEDKSAILQGVSMSEDNKEMLSFFSTIFGVKPDQDATAVDPKKNKKKKEDGEDDVSYHLSRYVPKLKKILEKLANNEASSTDFPFIKETPIDEEDVVKESRGTSVRTAKAAWTQKKKEETTKTRLIVFIVGGVTYSEIRSAYETQSRDVIIGSTNIWTPDKFIENLNKLRKFK